MNVVRSFWWDFSIVVSRSERSRTGKFLRLCERIITHPSYDTLMRVSITTSILLRLCTHYGHDYVLSNRTPCGRHVVGD